MAGFERFSYPQINTVLSSLCASRFSFSTPNSGIDTWVVQSDKPVLSPNRLSLRLITRSLNRGRQKKLYLHARIYLCLFRFVRRCFVNGMDQKKKNNNKPTKSGVASHATSLFLAAALASKVACSLLLARQAI